MGKRKIRKQAGGTTRSLRHDPNYLFYLIVNDQGQTYTGTSNNFWGRRLREHNQGRGARSTRRGSNWQPLVTLHGFDNEHLAKSFEWYFHRPSRFMKGASVWVRKMFDASGMTWAQKRALSVLFLLLPGSRWKQPIEVKTRIHAVWYDERCKDLF